MIIPAGATVFRIYELGSGSKEIVFEDGDPRDYIWSSWSKSNWKSIDWLLGKVPDDQYGIIEGAKNTEQQVQADNSCEHSFSPVYLCVHCGKIGDSIA